MVNASNYNFLAPLYIEIETCEFPPNDLFEPDLYTYPALSYQEYLEHGGFGYSDCGFDETNFVLIQQYGFFDLYQYEYVIFQDYELPDNCNEVMTCTVEIHYHFAIKPPESIYTEEICGTPEDIEVLTGLPLYTGNTLSEEISLMKFTEIGGQLSFECDINQNYHIHYIDMPGSSWSTNYCSVFIQRDFMFFDQYYNPLFTLTQTLDFYDYEPPVVQPTESTTFNCLDEVPEAFQTYDEFINAGGLISDNCSIDESSFSLLNETTSGSCPTTIARQYEIKDHCGNKTSWIQTIVVQDIISPVFLTQPQPVADVEFGSELPEPESLLFSDNCGTPDLTIVTLPYTIDPENGYSVTYVWKIEDLCGNTAETSVSFSVHPKAPEYCESSGNAASEWIKSVKIGDQENLSSNEGYKDFSDIIPFNLESSANYDITLTPDFSQRSTFEYWSVWIDWNADGEFTTNEQVYSAAKKRSATSGIISVPDLQPVQTRMRVSMSRTGIPQPCGLIGNGEVEDYIINITEAEPQIPVVTIGADKQTVFVGETVQFYDESSNNPFTWLWNFGGGEPDFSTEQNPVITYNTPGTYDVTLTVANEVGEATQLLTGFITVTEKANFNYCSSSSLSADKEWIAGVSLSELNKISGSSLYSDFTQNTATLLLGATETIRLIPGFSKNSQREYWKVWIDFNQDGDFDDADEDVFSTLNAKSEVTGSVLVPVNALTGTTRMRVSMKAGVLPTSCEIFDRGEVEDYSIDIVQNKSEFAITNIETVVNEWSIYPNPATETLFIKQNSTTPAWLKIFNSGGALVIQKELKTSLAQIDISKLANGVYYVNFESEKNSFKEKIIKQ